MPLAPEISLATIAATRAYMLTIGGTDVLMNGAGLGTPIGSIHVVEQGPGGISSLDLIVNDPNRALAIADGAEVQYWDVLNDVLLFRGYVDHWASAPAFGDQGRRWTISATGTEAWLDWSYIPPTSQPSGTPLAVAVSNIASLYAPWLRAPMSNPIAAPFSTAGSFLYPLGTCNTGPGNTALVATWQWPGGTLREAIASLSDLTIKDSPGVGIIQWGVPVLATVDFYMGLRMWEDLPNIDPDDYVSLVVTDTAAGAVRAANLSYGREPDDVIREVSVLGAGGALMARVGDGSGIRGRATSINDTSITTADQAQARGQGYLGRQSQAVRGTFELNDWAPNNPAGFPYRPGALLVLTDDPSGATAVHRIYSIEKTFNDSGRENWTIAFGGNQPSGAALARRLTRGLI